MLRLSGCWEGPPQLHRHRLSETSPLLAPLCALWTDTRKPGAGTRTVTLPSTPLGNYSWLLVYAAARAAGDAGAPYEELQDVSAEDERGALLDHSGGSGGQQSDS